MRRVQTRVSLQLVREPAVLVPRLHHLPPDGVKFRVHPPELLPVREPRLRGVLHQRVVRVVVHRLLHGHLKLRELQRILQRRPPAPEVPQLARRVLFHGALQALHLVRELRDDEHRPPTERLLGPQDVAVDVIADV